MPVLFADHVLTATGLRPAAVEITGDRITRVASVDAFEHIDHRLSGQLLLPGLVNAHSHAFQRAFRGRVQWRPEGAGTSTFWTWRDAMYRAANGLSPEGVEATSRLAFLEMVEAGITRVGEFHYLHHAPDGTRYADPNELAHRVIRAAIDVGLRITLLRVAYARCGPEQPLRPEQRRFGDRDPAEVLAALDRLRSTWRDGRVTVGLAPHSVRALPADWLAELAAWDGVVHAHVAEQPAEVRGCLREHGRHPLEVLHDAGLVTERFTAVHLTWPGPRDAGILRTAGAAVCACPSTELDLGDGFLPLGLRHGVRLSLGTDSQSVIDLLAEARALELHARALAGRRIVMDPGEPAGDRHRLAARLVAAASTDGERCLGGVGAGIAEGAPADLVSIDLDRPAAAGVPPLEAAVFVSTPEWVREVWVAGRRVVEDGRHPARRAIVEAAMPYLCG